MERVQATFHGSGRVCECHQQIQLGQKHLKIEDIISTLFKSNPRFTDTTFILATRCLWTLFFSSPEKLALLLSQISTRLIKTDTCQCVESVDSTSTLTSTLFKFGNILQNYIGTGLQLARYSRQARLHNLLQTG